MSHNAARKARRAAAVRERALNEAYAEANRLERTELTVHYDERLGARVDQLAETARRRNAIEASETAELYDIVRHCELATTVTTSDGMVPWDQARTARRVAISEIALVLRIPEQTAANRIETARYLVEKLPATMGAFSTGEFGYRYAAVIADSARELSAEFVADFEAAILPFASKLTLSKFGQKARMLREAMDASTIQQRHEKAFADRQRYFEPDKNGMGWLNLYTSAHIGVAIINRTDQMAEVAQQLPYEDRTLTQLRADMTTDLLLDGVIDGRVETSIRPSVVVTVPVLSMLDHRDANGELELPVLEGYGPIDIDTAKRLAAGAKSWLRVLTHPENGVTLSVGRTRHRVPAGLRNWLRRVDGTCRKPGCNRPAIRCDIDHTEEFQHGGMTAHDNLAHLCAVHHAEKHHTDVTTTHHANGNIEWRMPSGRRYVSEPAHRTMRPIPPERRERAA